MFKKNRTIKSDSNLLLEKANTSLKDRNGIVVFENSDDIFNIFLKKDADTSYEDGEGDKSKKNSDQGKRELKRDRHGVPFLDGVRSISKIFSDFGEAEKYRAVKQNNGKNSYYNSIDIYKSQEIEEDFIKETTIADESLEDDGNFLELVEESLKGKNRDTMMREKSDRPLPEPVPLKKRLKRYPLPQDEMDLHGHTAKEAESRTENYLRNCWRNGLFTVQIIVGRGIHSPYGAVLPDVVEDVLIRLKREGILLWFEWDRRTKSQSGSAIVYLKHF